MSTPSDTGLDLEALELQLLPAWARQSAAPNRYAEFEGDSRDTPGQRRDRRGPPGRRPDRGLSRGPGRGAPRRDADRGRGPRRPGGPRPGAGRRDAVPTAPIELPELNVSLIPEPKGVESLARQIRLTGRAYPIFEIAQLVLRKPDRYQVRFGVIRKPDGEVTQPLWVCNLDDTVWLSEADAVGHVLRKHLDTFYQAEKTPTEPPKGTYTFVAQCGMSGTILGPPNFHDYQAKLARLHSTRYSRMPFEVYKSKVRIVRDEAVVKQWIEEQSFKTDYICLNVPEALKLSSMAEVEAHFRQVHLSNIIRTVDDWIVDGPNAQRLPAISLRQLTRRAWDEQRRFPLKLVGTLSQQFASHGLQFFKVNKTVTHVSVARPHYLDLEATPVSDGIRRIVNYIDSHTGCTRRDLLDSLVPTPPAPPPQVEATPPAGDAGDPETAVTESGKPDSEPGDEGKSPASVPAEPKPAEPVQDQPQLTPEQTAVTADLHWLIHQGHVIEFANGKLETAKKPKPKPAPAPRPAPQPKVETQSAAEQPASDQASVEQAAAPEPKADASPTDAALPAEVPAVEEQEGVGSSSDAHPTDAEARPTEADAGEAGVERKAEPTQPASGSASTHPVPPPVAPSEPQPVRPHDAPEEAAEPESSPAQSPPSKVESDESPARLSHDPSKD